MIMYVGKGLRQRAEKHWRCFLKTRKTCNALLRRWFELLKASKVEPRWRFLEENISNENWKERERHHVAVWKIVNSELCNLLEGGNEWPIHGTKLGGQITSKLYPKLASNRGKIGGKRTHELHPEWGHTLGTKYGSSGGKIGGKIGGRKNVESGHLANLRTPEHQRQASHKGLHQRWHVNRGIIDDKCNLCKEERLLNG
jgi:hypothetical protein